ncbi:hypothetical protein [Edwardsiella hoshinae]|nr:hypothetical protein [Edwardsiella hoshinae]
MRLRFLSMLVAMSVAGVANAAAPSWVEGTTSFNKTFTASGTVLGKEFSQKWEWAVGSGLQGLQGAISQTSSNHGKITITVPTLTPILVGKSKSSITAPFSTGVGAIPHISFISDGHTVNLTGEGSPSARLGMAYLDVAVREGSNKIGTARLHLTYAGVVGEVTLSNNSSLLISLWAESNDDIFLGGLPTNIPGSEMDHAGKAVALIHQFGGLSQEELARQLQITQFDQIYSNNTSAETVAPSWKIAATYALGFKANQTIDVTFEQGRAPTNTTNWSASLGIQVTYV